MPDNFSPIHEKAQKYFSEKVLRFGATPAGVDWNGSEAQELRFEQLLKISGFSGEASINDFGCGYGALYEYLNARGRVVDYLGIDLCEDMIRKAREIHTDSSKCNFYVGHKCERVADYSVASGLFNLKLDTPESQGKEYIISVLSELNRASRKGFSFNCLTKYSDKEHMKDYLYYADPGFWFDHCKTNYSKYVSLLHDYPLYDFTILVRKEI